MASYGVGGAMHSFETPDFTPTMRIQWARAGKPSFNHPALLAEYHRRFNTISIPLSNPGAFFTDAAAASRSADSRADLEKKLDEMHQKRAQECFGLIKSLRESYHSAQGKLLPDHVREAALLAGNTGSLDNLLQFIIGVVFGWDAVEMKHLEPTPSLEVPGGGLSGTQYLPDVMDDPENYLEDDELGWDDDSWRVKETFAKDTLVFEARRVLPSHSTSDPSLPAAEDEACPEKSVQDPVSTAIITPPSPTVSLRPSSGRCPPSPPRSETIGSTTQDEPPTSPNTTLTVQNPNASHTACPKSHTASRAAVDDSTGGSPRHGPNNQEAASHIRSHACISADPPPARKRPRSEHDEDEDISADQRACQRRRTMNEDSTRMQGSLR